ncbi:YCF48-related protein [Algoriphagus sp. CAU 1675]|uniref:YCF48-related protein n=1 Tax=Algoriphagus sp. CAU 1675 TaxID=3032597 RepID=UPI0023DBB437|nr:YCF48-related protein [Algoriphagus sp. CAU 1675]MDF2156650.1 YCF48-related protein [Algoriphagus sp. CAU 1675]
MKKTLGLLFLSFIFSTVSFGQTWTRMQSWGLDLETVYWVNDTLAFAGGENLLIRTGNSGVDWEELSYTLEKRVLSIAFWDDQFGIAVGESGLILKTSDSGKTWELKTSGLTSDFYSVAFSDQNSILITGKEGKIIHSEDAGETWTSVTSGLITSLHELHFYNSDTAFLAGANGRILRSQDGGRSWRLMNSGTTKDLNGIAFSSPLVGHAVGNGGLIIQSTDGGQTWKPISSGVSTNLKKVAVSPLDTRIVTVVGDEATAIRSTNSGASFGKVNLGTGNTRNLTDVHYRPGTNQLLVTGQNGYLVYSTNGGGSYSQRLAGIRNRFSTADFKSNRVGFIGGENGAFYVTSNAALSLVSRPLPEPLDIVGMNFWNTGFGYVSGEGGKIYRTSNTGSSWVNSSISTPNQINGMYLFAPSIIYVAGNGGFISRSFDTALTWDLSLQSNTSENLKNLIFFDNQYGIAIGENGQLSWSDGGAVWETIPQFTTEHLNALAKLNADQAIVVGNQGTIFKTEDKGRTWRQINSGTKEDLLSVDFFGADGGYISGKNGITLGSNNGGEDWEFFDSGTSRDLISISTGTLNSAFAVGEDGTILRFICEIPSGLSQISGPTSSCLDTQTYTIPDSNLPNSKLVWRVDGGEIVSGQGSNEVEVLWTRTGRQGIFVSRSNFCGAGETSYMEVIVSDIPPYGLEIEGNASVCETKEATFSLPNLEGVNYTWQATGGEIVAGQGTSEVTVIWNELGLQTLTALPQNVCGEAELIQLTIFVNELPEAPGEIDGESILAPGESFYQIETDPTLTYKWTIIGDGARIVEGQGTGTIRVLWEKEGDYELQVRAQNTCDFGPARILPVIVSLVTALEPDPDLKNLKIYPNPSQGQLTIESSSLSQWSRFELLNSLGQILIANPINQGQTSIELSELPRGILFVRLIGQKSQTVKKVVVK